MDAKSLTRVRPLIRACLEAPLACRRLTRGIALRKLKGQLVRDRCDRFEVTLRPVQKLYQGVRGRFIRRPVNFARAKLCQVPAITEASQQRLNGM